MAFSPDGNTVAGGLIQGQVYFFEYESLKHLTQMDCKNHGGRYKRGAKVTGIAYLPNKPYLQASSMSSVSAGNQLSDNTSTANAAATAALTSSPQSAKESGSQSNATNSASYTASHMLVTTNDNRIRLCRLEDYSVVMKYKALKNETMQIKSQFSEDGKFIICGSDTGHVYIWRTNVQQDENPSRGFSFGFFQRNRTGRNSTVESFQDADDTTKATTVGIFAPIDAVHSFLASQIDYLDFVQQRPQSIGHSKLKQAMTEMEARDHREGSNAAAAGGNNGWRRSARMSVALDEADLCTRIIATADTDGSIRIYFRVNSANGPSAKTSTV